jgi:uncharacterized protein YndB with AHSA1/START domain
MKTIDPVRRSVIVKCAPAQAFRLFTDRIGEWWPIQTHRVSKDATTCAVETKVGGRLYEKTTSGEEHLWGTITSWEPPHRFGFTWHPGRASSTAQDVEVSFAPANAGTRVDVVHSGWERYGDGVDEARADYESGWQGVLGLFVEAASRA